MKRSKKRCVKGGKREEETKKEYRVGKKVGREEGRKGKNRKKNFGYEQLYLPFTGYMNGAVQAGERAAGEVLHQMKKISEEEIEPVEPPSEEVPPVSCELTTFQKCLPTVPVFLFGMALVSGAVGGFLSYKCLVK